MLTTAAANEEPQRAPLLVCSQAAEMMEAIVARLSRTHRMLMAARAMAVRDQREAWDARTDLLVQRALDLGVCYGPEQDRAIEDLQRCMEERAAALLWAADGNCAERAVRDEYVALATTIAPDIRAALNDFCAALPAVLGTDVDVDTRTGAATLVEEGDADAVREDRQGQGQGQGQGELLSGLVALLSDPHTPAHVAHAAAKRAGLSSWFARTFAVTQPEPLGPPLVGMVPQPTAAHPGWGDSATWTAAPRLRARTEAWPALWFWLQEQRVRHEARQEGSEFGNCLPVVLLVPNCPVSTGEPGWGALEAACRRLVTELLAREGFWLRCELRAWLNHAGIDGSTFFPVGDEEERALAARGFPRSLATALALPRGARYLLSAYFYLQRPQDAVGAEPPLAPLPREALVFCTETPPAQTDVLAGWTLRQRDELAGADLRDPSFRARWLALAQTLPP